MLDIVRDSTFGQIVHFASRRHVFKYPEQRRDFKVPEKFSKSFSRTSTRTLIGSETPKAKPDTTQDVNDVEAQLQLQQDKEIERVPTGQLVTWYGEDDPENPHNWSTGKKVYVTFLIAFLTFSVYIGSSIIAPSFTFIQERFAIGQVHAILVLSLFVLGYGIGPMFFSPLSEIPAIGRSPIYIVTLLLFILLQIPTIFAGNAPTLLAMRFLAGLVCSPALSTGGASVGDIWPQAQLPYALLAWSVGAVSAPSLGPVLSGFAVLSKKDWAWSIMILTWLASVCFILLFFTLPETSSSTILLRRAQRLRRLTNNHELQSQSEVDQAHMSPVAIVSEALYRPFRLLCEPIILYGDLYIGLVYAIFYCCFESFPMVYGEHYGFNTALAALPFLALIVGCFSASTFYVFYLHYYDLPKIMKKGYIPEDRLLIAVLASPFIPISILWFGVGYKVHWMFPTVGAGLLPVGIFLLFQSLVVYLPISYMKYSASVLASNALVRSSMACAFPLFAPALFRNLGIQGGNALLAGLTILLLPPLWILYRYGAKVRAMSSLATPM